MAALFLREGAAAGWHGRGRVRALRWARWERRGLGCIVAGVEFGKTSTELSVSLTAGTWSEIPLFRPSCRFSRSFGHPLDNRSEPGAYHGWVGHRWKRSAASSLEPCGNCSALILITVRLRRSHGGCRCNLEAMGCLRYRLSHSSAASWEYGECDEQKGVEGSRRTGWLWHRILGLEVPRRGRVAGLGFGLLRLDGTLQCEGGLTHGEEMARPSRHGVDGGRHDRLHAEEKRRGTCCDNFERNAGVMALLATIPGGLNKRVWTVGHCVHSPAQTPRALLRVIFGRELGWSVVAAASTD